jgi:tetratricopeptide (TPR) repeat protein
MDNLTILAKKSNNMKLLAIYIAIFFAMFWQSCNHDVPGSQKLLPELSVVESIMYEQPDSAYKILQNMRTIQSESGFQRATWALFMTQAKYKLYIDQSDSLINIASDYFMNRTDNQRKAMVLYYKAVLNVEQNDVKKAQEYLFKAAEYVKNTCDYRLGHLIHKELGNLFVHNNLPKYSFNEFQESYCFAKLSGNTDYIIDALCGISRSYTIQGDYENSIETYKNAIEIAQKQELYADESYLWTEVAGCYRHLDDKANEFSAIMKSITLKEKYGIEISSQNYFNLGHSYMELNKDSAMFYLNKALQKSNIYTHFLSSQDLGKLCYLSGNYKDAYMYVKDLNIDLDSIHKREQSEALLKMQQKHEKEMLDTLLYENKRSRSQRYIFSILLAVCIIAILFILYRLRKSKIKQNEKRIEELTALLAQHTDIQEQMEEHNQDLIEKQHSLDKRFVEITQLMGGLRKREAALLTQLIDKDEILETFRRADHFANDKEWTLVRNKIDVIFNKFSIRLSERVNSLTESDIRICCLIRLYITNKEAAQILGVSPSSVAKHKLRIKEKISNVVGPFDEDKSLDIWILEF